MLSVTANQGHLSVCARLSVTFLQGHNWPLIRQAGKKQGHKEWKEENRREQNKGGKRKNSCRHKDNDYQLIQILTSGLGSKPLVNQCWKIPVSISKTQLLSVWDGNFFDCEAINEHNTTFTIAVKKHSSNYSWIPQDKTILQYKL